MLFNSSLKGIDHLLIGVSQLEEARHHYLRLGFRLTPRGRHLGWGTANYCIMFPDDYLELIGVVDENQDTNGLTEFLEKGEGGLGLAFRSEDVHQSAACLAEKRVVVEGPSILKRILELDKGDAMPSFELLRYGSEVTPGIASFVCDHKTPDIVWQDPWLRHANGAKGVRRVVYVVSNPSELINSYSIFFGENSVVVNDGCIDIQLKEKAQIIRLIAPEDISRFYPGIEIPVIEGQKGNRESYMLALHLCSGDLRATQAYFDQYRVSYHKEGNSHLRIKESDACGVIISFDAEE